MHLTPLSRIILLMKILALDYGTARTGIALGDTALGVALPLTVLPTDKNLSAAIAQIAVEKGAEQILLGLPLGFDGAENAQTALVRAFAAKLAQKTALPCEFFDERRSSREAASKQKAAEQRGKSDDALAAATFLQTYLEKHYA